MLVTKMAARGPRLFGLDVTGSGIVAQSVFIRIIRRRDMAVGALPAAVVVVALEADPHHHILVIDIFFHIRGPHSGIHFMCIAVRSVAGTAAIYAVGYICMVCMIDSGGKVVEFVFVSYATRGCLRRQGFGLAHVTGETFGIGSLHMAVEALFQEALLVLYVLLKPERIAGIFMEHVIIVAIPARVAWKIGCRV
jgi:hypothetical protein